MPFVEGETLRDRLDAREAAAGRRRGAHRDARSPTRSTTRTRHGVIHRDIKPENILLQDGHALVADFGIALAVAAGRRQPHDADRHLARHAAVHEPRAGDGRARRSTRAATSTRSAPCSYEMLAGEPPFTGPTAQAIVAQGDDRASRRCPAHVARPCRRTSKRRVLTALAKLPADRFATAREFAEALRGAHERDARRGERADAAHAQPLRRAHGRGRLVALACAGVMAAMVVGAATARGTCAATTCPPIPVRFALQLPDTALPSVVYGGHPCRLPRRRTIAYYRGQCRVDALRSAARGARAAPDPRPRPRAISGVLSRRQVDRVRRGVAARQGLRQWRARHPDLRSGDLCSGSGSDVDGITWAKRSDRVREQWDTLRHFARGRRSHAPRSAGLRAWRTTNVLAAGSRRRHDHSLHERTHRAGRDLEDRAPYHSTGKGRRCWTCPRCRRSASPTARSCTRPYRARSWRCRSMWRGDVWAAAR